MTDKPYFIEYILNNHKITDYLAEKGYFPERVNGNRSSYVCPIHDDTDPSFYVFDNEDYQMAKCFGCGFYGDIINVYSKIENIPFKKAIVKLAKGLDVSDDVLIRDITNHLRKRIDRIDTCFIDVENIDLRISVLCKKYLESVDFDKKEVDFIDEFFEEVDKAVLNMNINLLKDFYFKLDEALKKRKKKYLEKNKEKPKCLKWNL